MSGVLYNPDTEQTARVVRGKDPHGYDMTQLNALLSQGWQVVSVTPSAIEEATDFKDQNDRWTGKGPVLFLVVLEAAARSERRGGSTPVRGASGAA